MNKMNEINKNTAILHGECIIRKIEDLPSKVVKLENIKNHCIIAESESFGNHHVVDCAEGVGFYELDGVRYMKNEKPANVRCVHTDRHDAISIPEGIWRFDSQLEYDYFEQVLRNVRD